MSPLGRQHLELRLASYLEHYLGGRFHQGLGEKLIAPAKPPANDNSVTATEAIRCRSRLGGLLMDFITTTEESLGSRMMTESPQGVIIDSFGPVADSGRARWRYLGLAGSSIGDNARIKFDDKSRSVRTMKTGA